MSTTTGGSVLPTPAATTMPAPSTSSMDKDMLMGMSTMSMTFFDSRTTPLFWNRWRPHDLVQYVATCVFLVALAIVTRILFAVRYSPIQSSAAVRHLPVSDKDAIAGSEIGNINIFRKWWGDMPFSARFSRATYEVILAFLGYLL